MIVNYQKWKGDALARNKLNSTSAAMAPLLADLCAAVCGSCLLRSPLMNQDSANTTITFSECIT